jgi:hypothetical protein
MGRVERIGQGVAMFGNLRHVGRLGTVYAAGTGQQKTLGAATDGQIQHIAGALHNLVKPLLRRQQRAGCGVGSGM